MADGFLGRWSQRKQAQRVGQALVETVPTSAAAGTKVNPNAAAAPNLVPDSARDPAQNLPPQPGAQPQPDAQPAPTLADVAALKPDDSFARFVAPDVAPDVRNAAMKKLFADPHYNVMDRLDIYIDDYSIPSPLPIATLRQMVSAKFLNLFEEEPPVASDTPATLPVALPAESAALPPTLDLIGIAPDDHLDLRLQPDHAAGPKGLECESERAPDAEFEPVPPPSR